jgi:hypothetical protein
MFPSKRIQNGTHIQDGRQIFSSFETSKNPK